MIGSRRAALVGEVDELRYPAYQQLQQEMLQRFMYLFTVCLIMFAVVSFVMLKIVPSYQAIFEDFDLDVPPITTWVINVSNGVGQILGPPLLLAAIIGALTALVIAIFYLCDIPILQRLTDRLTLARHRAQVMRLLAVGFDQSQPIDHSVRQLVAGTAPYPSLRIRDSLDAVLARITAGNEWQDSLAAAAIVSKSDAAVLRRPTGRQPAVGASHARPANNAPGNVSLGAYPADRVCRSCLVPGHSGVSVFGGDAGPFITHDLRTRGLTRRF